jgi:hypothetical protein
MVSLNLTFLNFKVCSSNLRVENLQILNFIINNHNIFGQSNEYFFKNWTKTKNNLGFRV